MKLYLTHCSIDLCLYQDLFGCHFVVVAVCNIRYKIIGSYDSKRGIMFLKYLLQGAFRFSYSLPDYLVAPSSGWL